MCCSTLPAPDWPRWYRAAGGGQRPQRRRLPNGSGTAPRGPLPAAKGQQSNISSSRIDRVDSPVAEAHRLLAEAVDALAAATESGAATDAELLSALTVCEGLTRRLDRLTLTTIATLQRRGAFTERGYKSTAGALSDLLGWEGFEAGRRVHAADLVCPRIGLDGTVLPPRLAATAAVFAAGQARLRHVEVIAKLLDSPAARRLTPHRWAGAEATLAGKAAEFTPSGLRSWGAELIEKLDEDGPEPDDRPPAPVNELHLLPHRGRPGGTLKGRFDDPALYDAIATLIDTMAAPRTGDDERSPAQRQAEALAEVCGYVLDHGDVPDTGGRRPHLNVIIDLEDLEGRAKAAMLDFGGRLSPEALRLLACDAAVVPIVMNGAGQPLDVGGPSAPSPTGYAARWPPATGAAPAAADRRLGAKSTTL
jgi:5-methylcytosine-specific restriction protein A